MQKKDDYASCFEALIKRASDTYKSEVVVLIDKYDKPILDKIEEKEIAKKNREILKNFYSVLKPLDAYLKFVFITGVSKFSKVSLFSGLNQLNDITLDKAFAEICGYTQKELETVFAEELKDKDLSAIKCWYNGYSFCGEPLYNPFNILPYLQKGEFHPLWFETATLEFLIKLLFDKRYFLPNLQKVLASDSLLSSLDVDLIEPEALLFQTGYLTIKEPIHSPRGLLNILSYPNKEVKIALSEHLFNYYTQSKTLYEKFEDLYSSLNSANLSLLKDVLLSLFTSIPYEWFKKKEK